MAFLEKIRSVSNCLEFSGKYVNMYMCMAKKERKGIDSSYEIQENRKPYMAGPSCNEKVRYGGEASRTVANFYRSYLGRHEAEKGPAPC